MYNVDEASLKSKASKSKVFGAADVKDYFVHSSSPNPVHTTLIGCCCADGSRFDLDFIC